MTNMPFNADDPRDPTVPPVPPQPSFAPPSTGDQRPQMALIAAIVGMVTGGLGIIFGLSALTGLAGLGAFGAAIGLGGYITMVMIFGVISMVVAAGALLGGLQLYQRKSNALLTLACLVSIGVNILSWIVFAVMGMPSSIGSSLVSVLLTAATLYLANMPEVVAWLPPGAKSIIPESWLPKKH